jgi:hypothetical protein
VWLVSKNLTLLVLAFKRLPSSLEDSTLRVIFFYFWSSFADVISQIHAMAAAAAFN